MKEPKSSSSSATDTTLYIKNMVCDRCIRVVREELGKLGLEVQRVTLGEAVVAPRGKMPDREVIASVLKENGFELLDDKRQRTVERIKKAVIALVHRREGGDDSTERLSEYVAKEVGMDYRTLSTLFSSLENLTIERYFILQRIERVKELLKYDEKTLSEIAYEMGFSSVAHLSAQFKNVTGLSATEYKAMKDAERKPIDAI